MKQGPAKKLRPIVTLNRQVGRNDPCPCKSGKKWKRCCLTRLNGTGAIPIGKTLKVIAVAVEVEEQSKPGAET